MYRIRINLVAIAIVGLAHITASGQKFKQTIESFRKEYENLKSLHVIMNVQVLDSGAHDPYFSQRADIRKDGTRYRYEFDGNDMLMNDKHLIVVDRNAKQIILSKRDTRAVEFYEVDPLKLNMDSVLNAFGEPTFVKREDDIEHYRVEPTTSMIDRMDLYFNIPGKHIERIEYRYRDSQSVSIVFEVFDKSPVFAPDAFSEKNYVTAVSGQWKAVGAFKGFDVLEIEDY